jgi:hypothetical protein
MSSPVFVGVSNDELDWLIWHALRDDDRHPTWIDSVVLAANGCKKPLWKGLSRINNRMQAMRKAGRIRFWRHPPADPSIKAHGWEVLGCPGAGIQEDGQFSWAYGCADCLRRVRPDPADGAVEPPLIIAFECKLRIEP